MYGQFMIHGQKNIKFNNALPTDIFSTIILGTMRTVIVLLLI